MCDGCSLSYFANIKRFHQDDIASLKCFSNHGVIFSTNEDNIPNCPNCEHKLKFVDNKFRCYHTHVDKKHKNKRKRCSFNISIFNGSFLSGSKLSPSQILVFIISWLEKSFCHDTVIENLNISRMASVDWRSFCSEVTEHWFNNQNQIGGENLSVEIDETLISRRKYNRGRLVQQVWLFGGIERISKKRFVVPLLDEDDEPLARNKENLIKLIKKFIRKGSTIYSDLWKAYDTLKDEGYKHFGINHSLNFVDPQNSQIHTQNIERLWLDVKQYIKRPGMQCKFLKQYLGRYLFLKEHKDNTLHSFLMQAKNLYPPSLLHKEKDRFRSLPFPAVQGDENFESENDVGEL